MSRPPRTRYRILAGHPVPFSLTVQRIGGGPALRRLFPAARLAVKEYLALHLPGAKVTRIEGAYVFYELPQATSERSEP